MFVDQHVHGESGQGNLYSDPAGGREITDRERDLNGITALSNLFQSHTFLFTENEISKVSFLTNDVQLVLNFRHSVTLVSLSSLYRCWCWLGCLY